jgi:hypothetical protein
VELELRAEGRTHLNLYEKAGPAVDRIHQPRAQHSPRTDAANRVLAARHAAHQVLADAATVPLTNPAAVADMVGRLQATVETLLAVIDETSRTEGA